METFTNIVTVPTDRVAIVKAFATEYYDRKESIQTERSGDRDNRETRIKQGMIGKLAEEAVAKMLRTDVGPDYTHYATGTVMSEQPDLTFANLRIHVKACKDFYNEPRMSWLASHWHDPIVTKPEPNDVIAFCAVSSYTNEVKVMAFVFASELVDKWGDPHREDLKRRGKRAVDWKDLKTFENSDRLLKLA